tara:strand:- start:403 stop:510 length:108 start_codon:yes stop_codon:yes gene_type:complete
MFKKKKKDLWYSSQVNEMWRKIEAGIEVKPKNYLR